MNLPNPNQNSRSSISEDHGIAILSDQDLQIYSVGISTGGSAEIRMAEANPKRHIIATTIDSDGAVYAHEMIQEAKLDQRIEVKIEDITQPLPYDDGHFDFIYARLILHYLPKLKLVDALNELYRVLRAKGKIFVVVRSDQCVEANGPDAIFDSETGMTTYIAEGRSYSKYFHTEESIVQYLKEAGFHIEQIKSYEELLCSDFQRMKPASYVDVLIEVIAAK